MTTRVGKIGEATVDSWHELVRGVAERDDIMIEQNRGLYQAFRKWFPVPTLNRDKIKTIMVGGAGGVIGMPIDGPVEYSLIEPDTAETEIRWDKYAYCITEALMDKAMTERLDPTQTYYQQGAGFFGRVEDWRLVRTLRAGARTTTTLDDDERWFSATGGNSPNVEANIAEAIMTLMKEGDVPQPPAMPNILVIFPIDCSPALTTHQDVMHTTMTVTRAIKDAWKDQNVNIEFVPFIPHLNSDKEMKIDLNDVSSDALADPSTGVESAIVCITGRDTMIAGEYISPVARRVATYDIPERGTDVYHKRATGALVVPNYGHASQTTKIYRIDNVMAPRS